MLLADVHPDIVVAVSEVGDGSMKLGGAQSSETPARLQAQREVVANRRAFLQHAGCDPALAVRVHITYDRTDFCQYRVVGGDNVGAGIGDGSGCDVTEASDALATTTPGQALLLPVADCMPLVAYDPEHRAVVLSHLGRHSVEQHGGTRTIAWMHETFGSDPAQLVAWLGPSPNGEVYPLYACGDRDFDTEVTAQLQQAGLSALSILHSRIDTATDPRFFSHSEFLAGRRREDGRYAIAVALRQL